MRAFEGLTVLELGHFVAVPWAGQILADGGAHVIKVEPREGEPSRHIAPLAPGRAGTSSSATAASTRCRSS
jgi:crotonobetainyl-CoA:carnitine CoA-transferase CaiB-like acyl-CoA transferase